MFRQLIFVVAWICVLGIAGPMTARETSAAMRTIEGRYVRITTDLPATAERDQWAAAVDAAIPLFCEFWQVPLDRVDGWRVDAYVMSAKEPFLASGSLPASVPDFNHGFQVGDDVWLLVQPSEYYTRHLLLHEVAHAFAFHVFGGAGPAWFMEGTAEYLATHRWDGLRLEIGVVPESSTAFPCWGRFKLLDQRRRELAALSLISVLRYSDTAHRQIEPYAWTWAAIQLLASRPATREVLVNAARNGSDATPEFTRDFVAALGPEWSAAQLRWRLTIDEFDYGYDWSHSRIETKSSTQDESDLSVRADLGWQDSGWDVAFGDRLEIQAEGRVVLDTVPRPWISEPEGVTIEYHRGRPLGRLIATVVPLDTKVEKLSVPPVVLDLGAGGQVESTETGRLFLKVVDDPAKLGDNSGQYLVRVKKIK